MIHRITLGGWIQSFVGLPPPSKSRQKTQYALWISAARDGTMAMAAKKGEAKGGTHGGSDWFEALDAELEKKTQEIAHAVVDDKPHLRVTFEYCEGEHYYKYSGWKRIWSVHTLLDVALNNADIKALRKLFADVVKVWYESHLRRNRDLLIKHLKAEYERVETFNQ